MSSSDTRCNSTSAASAADVLRPTLSLFLLMVSVVPHQLDAVCSGRLESERRMYYGAERHVKPHSQGVTLYFVAVVPSALTRR